MAGGGPGLDAAVEGLGLDAGGAKPGGDAGAEAAALPASDDDLPAGELGGPGFDGGEVAARRARDQRREIGEILVGADVDDRRAVRRADQTDELVGGNIMGGGHEASSLGSGRDASACRLMGRSRAPSTK